MKKIVAFTGNPNAGKTTLFNELSGTRQYVGNWPGVTVEKKEAGMRGAQDIRLVDLPGTYSLSPYSSEERIARNYLIEEAPSLVVAVVDASNLERNLYLCSQLVEMGRPLLIALNMMDVVEKRKQCIDVKALSEKLGVPIYPVAAINGTGMDALRQGIEEALEAPLLPSKPLAMDEALEADLLAIEAALESVPEAQRRYVAMRLFEQDLEALASFSLTGEAKALAKAKAEAAAAREDDTPEGVVANARYEKIAALLDGVSERVGTEKVHGSDRIDRLVTSRIFGLPIFVLIMFFVYWISTFGGGIGDTVTGWTNDVFVGEMIQGNVASFVESIGASEFMQGLIVDGIVGGVGAVIGFLPQMAMLFFALSLLEQVGYMARVAFLMDRLFRRFGLSGKSFIPILVSSGCAVPGIMATRTIENERDRRMTIMLTPMIPCGAKLPVIALIAGAIFNEAWWFAPVIYFICIGTIVLSGIILKKFKYFAGEPAPFVMELPPYHLPSLKNLFRQIWERVSSFVAKAGTVILLSSIVIWLFTNLNFSFQMVSEQDESIFAQLAMRLEPLFAPLGFPYWQAIVGTVAGLVAKENLLSAMAVLYPIASDAAEAIVDDSTPLWTEVHKMFAGNPSALAAGLSWLSFNMLCIPCFAAIGSTRREMASSRWTWFTIAFQIGVAYLVAFILYHLLSLILAGVFGVMTVVAALLALLVLYLLFRPQPSFKKGA